MTSARQALLDRAIAHVSRHGLSDVSLRELAAAIGSNHRMLIYHFGSRDGLVAALAASIEEQERARLAALAAQCSNARELIERQWQQLSDPAMAPFIRLFFEVLSLGLHGRPGTERFIETLTEPWLELGVALSTNFGEPTSTAEIRLGVAVLRGLLIDLIASGDVDGVNAALQAYLSRGY